MAFVKLKNNVVVPENSEMVLNGYLGGSSPMHHRIVESSKFIKNKGLMVARSIIDTNNSCQIVSVLNIHDKPITLKRDEVLATVGHVTEISRENSDVESEVLPENLTPLIENISENLNIEEREKLKSLTLSFKDIFVGADGKVGQTDLVTHKIDTGDNSLIRLPPRRIAFKQREIIDAELDKMLQKNVIEPSESPWRAPVCLVTKKDGTPRFCFDFRKLNITKKDAYPLPRIDDALDKLAGNKWFSTLDLASGYWQIKMDKTDKIKTAFTTHRGFFQFNVMAFGLCNAPATFQRLMEKVLGNLPFDKCFCYLDDIRVFGKDFENAQGNLHFVFGKLCDAGLNLKPKKCSLFQEEVTYIGHLVSEKGIQYDPEKTRVVENWPRPESKRDVRSFLGFVVSTTEDLFKRFLKSRCP